MSYIEVHGNNADGFEIRVGDDTMHFEMYGLDYDPYWDGRGKLDLRLRGPVED